MPPIYTKSCCFVVLPFSSRQIASLHISTWPKQTTTSLTFSIIHDMCIITYKSTICIFLTTSRFWDKHESVCSILFSSISHVEWMLREFRASSACRLFTYNYRLSIDFRLINFYQFRMNGVFSLVFFPSMSNSSSLIRSHLYYSLLLLFIHLYIMHLCKCNYSFFYSSKNEYHVYQHQKISMRAKNIIPRCNVDERHSLYGLQWSSVIVFMSFSHACMSIILVKLAYFVRINSNSSTWLFIDVQSASVVGKLCVFHDRYS